MEATYTGVQIKPTVTGTLTKDGRTHMLDPSEYTATYSGNTDVGTAAVTVTSNEKNFTGGTRKLGFTIKKATNDVSVSLEGWASGDDAKSPSVTATADADTASVAYKVKGAGDATYTDAVPSAPGEYTVRATIPESDNYEAGVATADFTIAPMPLTIDSATAMNRAYEKDNATVAISDVTFKNGKGEPVPLTLGTDYVASGKMADADAGGGKDVAVTVKLRNGDYSLTEGGDTTTALVNIDKAETSPMSVRIVGFITYPEDGTDGKTIAVNHSVADMVPADAGESYTAQQETVDKPLVVEVKDFSVDSDGLVTATLLDVEQGDESENVVLPVVVASQNYKELTINAVVVPKEKTYMEVAIGSYDRERVYGDDAFELLASVRDPESGADIETQDGDWYWYSSDPSVLEVAERGSSKMSVSVKGTGSAIIQAWYEPSNGSGIGTALTEYITVNKRPLTIMAMDKESIYVGGEVPTLPDNLVEDMDYTVGPDGGGLADGDSLSGLQLAYSPAVDNTRPGTYAVVPSGASVLNGQDDASANYSISYVDGKLAVMPKETQAITADDVEATYGQTEPASVSATADGDGMISYAVKTGRDCIGVDSSTGALTIKKAGTATVAVTATATETYAQTTKDVDVTILKADAAPATITESEWTYDGTNRRLVIAEGVPKGGTMQYAVSDSAESAPISGWNSSIPTGTNAGTYYVWYKVKGDENHNDTRPQQVDVHVGKADLPAEAPGPLSATCGDLLEDVKLPKAENGTWSWGANQGARVEHAGKCYFDATFTPNDTTNYSTIEGVPVLVNAAKGESSVKKAPKGKTLTYNGKAQALVTTGAAAGGTMQYSLDGKDFTDEIPVGVVAGDYTVWYKVAGDKDHNDSELARVKATIGKASIAKAKVTLAKTSYTYDGKAKEPKVKSVVLDGRTLRAGTDYTVTYKDNVKVGTATVTVTGTGNYTGSARATFAIGLAKAELSTIGHVAKLSIDSFWKEVVGAEGYQLQYREAGGTWKTLTAKGTSKTVGGLKLGKVYQFRVRAKAGKHTGAWSNVSRRYFRRVSGLKASVKKPGSVTASWKADSKANAGYVVLVRYEKGGKVVVRASVAKGKTKATVKGLEKGRSYLVQVRPMRTSGGETYTGVLRGVWT